MNTDNILEWDKDQLKSFMKSVWFICVLSFKYGINPAPALRKQFPYLTWEFMKDPTDEEQKKRLYPAYGNKFRTSNLLWDLDDGLLFATLIDKSDTFGAYTCNLNGKTMFSRRILNPHAVHFFPATCEEQLYGELSTLRTSIEL